MDLGPGLKTLPIKMSAFLWYFGNSSKYSVSAVYEILKPLFSIWKPTPVGSPCLVSVPLMVNEGKRIAFMIT